MNPYEGLRVFFSLVLIVISLYAINLTNNGLSVYDYSIRKYINKRRKMQSVVMLMVGTLLLLHSIIASFTVDSRPIDDAILISVNVIIILVQVILIMYTTYQFMGWLQFENVLANKPLNPTTEEQKIRAINIARLMGHSINDNLALINTEIQEILIDPAVPEEVKQHVTQVLDRVIHAGEAVQKLHKQVKSL